ncbi:PEP-CTERM sorting domain-containing protein [Coraliomargarita sp. SDUM461004]|uniref:PEP-CTERM sorting domain-containing protein n=1 Tax=Thalassobacterium sedimentorum TaxID=3041258 RepID=A0ABU1AFV5_9BACT|nr:PEP-CTERM sorting domain-containing protein [Coraliomargarita sp. SDUM461004]MDQ8193023.1 PEP-CTERM sorting domain-containing protein [Coraliomargarita sp. SDUM461004]
MKIPTLIILSASVALTSSLSAQATFDYNFTGDGSTDLHGVDGWIVGTASSSIKTDGSTSGSNGAVIAYDFGSGVYETSTYVDMSAASGNNFAAGLFFTNSDPVVGGYVTNSVSPFGTFGIRGNGNLQFWSGEGTAGGVAAGNISNFGYDSATNADMIGLLRVVLDTTVSNWTISAFYTPSTGTEFQVDLNGAASGAEYTYAVNPDNFTGAGIMWSAGGANFDSYSLVPESSSSALLGGVVALMCLAMRRRVR